MGKLINANQEEFQQILDSEKNILLVDFYANWCGPCKTLSPELEKVSEEVENVTVVKINVDENPELSAKYGIRNLPTVIVIKEGQQVDKFVGLQNKDKIIEILNRHNTPETNSDES